MHKIFLSTPSARRATVHVLAGAHRRFDFYPRPPRGGRRRSGSALFGPFIISIHALREEGDPYLNETGGVDGLFLSTPSARRATTRRSGRRKCSHHFYPRPPRGGRLGQRQGADPQREFLSTPSARRATTTANRPAGTAAISIHALREEGDDPRKHRTRQAV